MKSAFISNILEDTASAFKPSFNIYDELDRLYIGLRKVNVDKKVIETDWWQRYKKWAMDNIADWDAHIIALSANPVKNEKEIMKKHSLREAMSMLISTVENSIRQEKAIVDKINYLDGITKQSKPPQG